MIVILGIESSCDETAASICCDGKILSNVVANQEVHIQYGGVVPELASREHIRNIVPVVEAAVKKASQADQRISLSELNAVAFTQAPGLIGALLVGAQFAKSVALAQNIPIIGVHHMQAHVLANLIRESGSERVPSFPFLCLTVSGGHTQIVRCDSPAKLEVLGETQDDAAGEAFDKSARLLGFPYPGGPYIDRFARQGNPERFSFPEPQVPGLDFSFSGLKTAILYFLQSNVDRDGQFVEKNLADICAAIQFRIITILLNKLVKAAVQTGIKDICLAGGVSANKGLREEFVRVGNQHNWNTFIPKMEYCTDNAAMIAITGYYKFMDRQFDGLGVVPTARSAW